VSRTNAAPRRTQVQRRAEAERRLLEAAAELLGEAGTARLTLAAIGARAGYSRGLVTHHFGSKAVLIQRLVEVVRGDFLAAYRRASLPGSPADQLLAIVCAFVEMLAGMHPIHRAFLVLWADAVASSPDVRPAMAASDREFRVGISEIVARGAAAGAFPRTVDAAGLAAALVGMLRGLALQFLLDPEGVDLEAGRVEIERLLIARLGRAGSDVPAIAGSRSPKAS
jgi:AcrR family transcriptional regulator